MTIFSCNNLSKSYDRGVLFDGVSFGMDEGDRIGLIGRNGIGKTTLMNIIAGREYPDSGEVIFNNNIRFEYLDQEPVFEGGDIVIDAVMSGRPRIYELLNEYHILCTKLGSGFDEKNSRRVEELTSQLDALDAWSLETEAKIILDKLGIFEFDTSVSSLSGGLRKRVALARALLSDPDLLILDEPTNHLDADSVQWLQDRLMNTGKAIMFVTHDRYFLDAVATRIIELDQKRIFHFPGNYEKYLEQKESFIDSHNSTIDHIKVKLRQELAWLQRGARARRSKQKSKIDWIEELSKHAKYIKERKIKIELGKNFLGSRIIDANNISKEIGGKKLFEDYTYIAKPGDRIGIIGRNGSGKSTLLNVLCGYMPPDDGNVKIGESVKIGYFTQENTELKNDMKVIDALRDIADYIDCGIGRERYITAKELLNRFLFPPKQHSALIETLSGGEKRRLAILRVLMANPNVIFLDEPTNDLDIQTLNALEDYLDNFYGVLIVVSHDRAFLDRTVQFILSFEGGGRLKEYPGNYSAYLEKKEEKEKNTQKPAPRKEKTAPKRSDNGNVKVKLSYMEQREFDMLEKEIPELEDKKRTLEEYIPTIDFSNYKLIEEKSSELAELEKIIDEKTLRWLELSESVG